MKKLTETNCIIALLVSLGAVSSPSPAKAQGYDMDCAVILCLAGGFPTGCSAAYSYMIKRITSWKPKPPFGFCAMGNLDDVDFPDNDAPEAREAMMSAIKDEPLRRTLESVRVEISRFGPQTCYQGKDQDPYNCSSMISMKGDGSELFIGKRGTLYNGFWRKGKFVDFIDHEGTAKRIGDAEHYYDSTGWRSIATPYTDYIAEVTKP